MKLLLISGIAAIALLASAATVLWSHSPSTNRSVGSTGMMSLQELHTAANRLPVEDFEDQSLVFSSAPKH
jgi:hypothetical protein